MSVKEKGHCVIFIELFASKKQLDDAFSKSKYEEMTLFQPVDDANFKLNDAKDHFTKGRKRLPWSP